jgi:transcriptional regulator with XRE-family HTH domain
MTQEGLAHKTGLSASYISALEKGVQHQPSLATMLALREALDLGSIEELLGPLPSHGYRPTRPARSPKKAPHA